MKSHLKENKDSPLQITLLISDILLIFFSFVAVYFFRYRVPGIPGPGFHRYQNSILIVTFLWIGIFSYFGLYRIRHAWRYSEVFFSSALAVTVGMVFYLAISFMLKETFISRLLLIFLWVLNIILVSGSRIILKVILLRIRKKGIGIRRILIVGNTASSKMFTKIINLHPELGYKIIGYLVPEGTGETNGAAVTGQGIQMGGTQAIIEETKKLEPAEVIFTIPVGKREELWTLINSFQKEGIEVKIVPDIYEVFFSRMALEDLEGVPMIRFRPITPQAWERIFKLMLDYLGATVLLIFFSPLIVYISLRLKFSPGKEVLTRETVAGLINRPFQIYRFRIPMKSVHSNPVENIVPIPFGEFLYRYSLSDLPQLINVLKGEMSLVGPRPEPPSRVERYSEWHRRRLLIKPGITGLAQVNGLRGFDSSDEKTHFDLKYMEEHSVFLDIKILLQTIWVLLKRHHQPISSFPLQTG